MTADSVAIRVWATPCQPLAAGQAEGVGQLDGMADALEDGELARRSR